MFYYPRIANANLTKRQVQISENWGEPIFHSHSNNKQKRILNPLKIILVIAKIKVFTKQALKARNRVRFHRQVKKQLRNQEEIVKEYIQNETAAEQIDNIETLSEKQIISLEEKLKIWIIKYKIKRAAVNDLLKILKSSADCHFLPDNSKTLLKSSRNIIMQSLSGGKYWYNGIENSLHGVFSNLDHDIVLLFNFNIDGLPLTNSSTMQFWPICGNIHSKKTGIQYFFSSTKQFYFSCIIDTNKTYCCCYLVWLQQTY